MIIVILFSCDRNSKLNQENAKKPINEMLSSFSDSYNGTIIIKSIEQVNQFSENEATIIVHTEYKNPNVNWNWEFKFIYKRNMDKKWVLTAINPGVRDKRDGSSLQSDFCEQLQNLNKIVQ